MKKKIRKEILLGFGLFAVSLTSCISLNKTERNPASALSADYNMSCGDFFSLLKEKKPTTVKGALDEVRRMRPKFMSQHTVAYDSKSLHGSSFENPRALVFGGDAKTVLSFNGHPDQAGYERIEMMCFNDESNTFDFRDVAFPAEAKNDSMLKDIPESKRKLPFVISGRHGDGNRKCTACHGSPARPNWHPYNLWPGICGTDADSYFENKRSPSQSQPSSYPRSKQPTSNLTIKSNAETKGCDQFYNGTMSQGRYAALLPYEYSGPQFDPNFQFGVLLTRLNGRRIVGDLGRKKPDISAVKYQLAEALFCNYPDYRNPKNLPYHKLNLLPKPLNPTTLEFMRDNMKTKRYRLSLIENKFGEDWVNHDGFSLLPDSDLRFLSNYYGIQPADRLDNVALKTTLYGAVAIEANQLAQISELIGPLGFDIRNWGMATGGGYDHQDGLNGLYGTSFQLSIEKPFLETFLPDEKELLESVEKMHHEQITNYGVAGAEFDPGTEVPKMRKRMCDIARSVFASATQI